MTRAVGILGVGHYVPEKTLTNFDLEKMVDTSDEWITERTGIKQRHIAAPEEATSDLAYNAAVKALGTHPYSPYSTTFLNGANSHSSTLLSARIISAVPFSSREADSSLP